MQRLIVTYHGLPRAEKNAEIHNCVGPQWKSLWFGYRIKEDESTVVFNFADVESARAAAVRLARVSGLSIDVSRVARRV